MTLQVESEKLYSAIIFNINLVEYLRCHKRLKDKRGRGMLPVPATPDTFTLPSDESAHVFSPV